MNTPSTSPTVRWLTGSAARELPLGGGAREWIHLHGPRRDRDCRGAASFDDGTNRFSIALTGPGAVDWSYDPAIGELQIDGLRGTDRSSELFVVRHAGEEFHVADAALSGALGGFWCNAIFGELSFGGRDRRFTFGDGRFRVELGLPHPANVHYDGALGSLDATPVDGALRIVTRTELCVPCGAGDCVTLRANASDPDASLEFQQVQGTALRATRIADGGLLVETEDLGAGRLAVFAVTARHRGAVAIESIVVHGVAAHQVA
jgi:hypothetical protein